MALTISTAEGSVSAEHSDDGDTVTLDVLGSRATLTTKDANLLADYLTNPRAEKPGGGELADALEDGPEATPVDG
jgi:hypothetical protein